MEPERSSTPAAAEQRLVQAANDTRQSLRRARGALAGSVSRSVSLALLAGGSGLVGYWFARRSRPRPHPATGNRAGRVATSATAAFVPAWIARYGMGALLSAARDAWHSQRHASASLRGGTRRRTRPQ